MILCCPACDARYTVADGAVPPQGRVVRCAACTHSWRAHPAETLALSDPAPAFSAAPAFAGAGAAAAPLPQRFRAKVQEERATRQAVATGAVWAVMGAAFLTLLGGAALFRVQVVRMIPSVAGAYAAVHLPVNPTGLALENVQGGPGLVDGRAVIIVTGVQRNVETDGRAASPMTVQLIDKAGRAVAQQPLDAPGATIAPGETRGFKAVFENPPISAAEFQVDFDFSRKPPAVRKSTVSAPALRITRLPPPPPQPTVVRDAAAVPADSPYALPLVAVHNDDHDPGHHP